MEADGLIQALCWSDAASCCPSTSGGKWLNGRTPQRALPNQKGGASPTPPV